MLHDVYQLVTDFVLVQSQVILCGFITISNSFHIPVVMRSIVYLLLFIHVFIYVIIAALTADEKSCFFLTFGS